MCDLKVGYCTNKDNVSQKIILSFFFFFALYLNNFIFKSCCCQENHWILLKSVSFLNYFFAQKLFWKSGSKNNLTHVYKCVTSGHSPQVNFFSSQELLGLTGMVDE